jgi:NADH-quinone oxidoreductase subunit E
MNESNGGWTCAGMSWLVALLGGGAVFLLLLLVGDWTILQSVFAGGVAFLAGGAFLTITMCRPLPPPGAGLPTRSEPAAKPGRAQAPAAGGSAEGRGPTAAAGPAPAAPSAGEGAGPGALTPAAAPSAQVAAAPARPAVAVLPELPGEAELARRQADWHYAPEAPPAGPSRPAGLAAPRGGKADDLKQIKGIGPKLEQLLHSLGYFHFDQIAAWTPAEVAWVDENLEGFHGRVTRDNWVAQAKVLAAGGQTEFSKRVERGEV